jgi:hypothetical protein
VSRARRIRREVRQATIAVHRRGEYPGNNHMKGLLHKPALMREPTASAGWHDALAELGWTP